MRFSSFAVVAVTFMPLAVSAKGTFGYALGVRNHDKSCKTQEDFEAVFDTMKKAPVPATIVRTYAVNDQPLPNLTLCNVPDALLPAAKAKNMQVVLGLWADKEESYQKDKATIKDVLNKDKEYKKHIYAFTVGSEGLYRQQQHREDPTDNTDSGYGAEEILARIQDLKGDFKDIKVGTADSWNKFQDGTADPLITGGVDILLVNAFGYWQKQSIENATKTYFDDLQQAFGHIQSVAGSTTSIELWNGETGWPTNGGTDYGAAQASTANAQTFYKEAVCAALDWNISLFYFEAQNEGWKVASRGADEIHSGDETHWGAYDESMNPVLTDLSCTYP